MKCDHCAADAVVIAPGSEAIHELFLLRRGVPDRRWCLSCAQQAGFPWLTSEVVKPRHAKPQQEPA